MGNFRYGFNFISTCVFPLLMSSFASFLFCSVFEIRFQIWFTYAIFIHQASHWCKLVYGKIVSNFIRRKTEMIYFQIYSSHVRVRFQPTDDIFPRLYLKLNKNDFSLLFFHLQRRKLRNVFAIFRFGWNGIEKFRFGLHKAARQYAKGLLSECIELHFRVWIAMDFDR